MLRSAPPCGLSPQGYGTWLAFQTMLGRSTQNGLPLSSFV